MGKKNKKITSQDVINLIEAKASDPKISLDDIFRKVDSIKPNYIKDLWKLFWLPLLIWFVTIFVMLFYQNDTPLFRLALIFFILSSFLGSVILRRYDYSYLWIIFVDAIVIFIIFSEKIIWEDIVKFIKEIL